MALRQIQDKRSKSTTQKFSQKPASNFKGVTTMADLLAKSGSRIPALRRGQEVKGKIVSIEPSEILIDIGAKSEGIVFGRELDSVRDLTSKLAVGDNVEATVLYPENEAGQVVLSLKKQSGERRWRELEDKLESGESIKVTACEVNRGGIICEYHGLRGFLPSLQIFQPSLVSGNLIGRTFDVKIIDLDKASNRVIFSQKQEKEELETQKRLALEAKIGEKYQGKVKAVLPFGVLVEIELEEAKGTKVPKRSKEKAPQTSDSSKVFAPSKLVGLIHISEISWEKIDDLTKLFKVGEQIEVMLIDKDEDTGKVSFSVKQLAEDPFEKVSGKYSKDMTVSGNISKITQRGIFVALEDGIEGFIASSKVPPEQSLEVGQAIECTIESVDIKKHKILLVPVTREKPILYR